MALAKRLVAEPADLQTSGTPASGLAFALPRKAGSFGERKRNPARWGSKGGANQEVSDSHQRITGQPYHQIRVELGWARNLMLRRRSNTSPSRAARVA